MNTSIKSNTYPRNPWLDTLLDNPDEAVSRLFRGEANLAELQRASPCEALLAMFDDLSPDSPEKRALDLALMNWLRYRVSNIGVEIKRDGNIECFIRETGTGIRASWKLDLPNSMGWLRRTMPNLLIWSSAFKINDSHDLERELRIAEAKL